MNSDINKAEKLISSLHKKVKERDLEVSEIVKKQYNFEFDISESQKKIKILIYYGKKGVTTVIQGNKESNLYRQVSGIVFGEDFFVKSSEEIDEPVQYIGTDESGKGDYFGPLVIAGVYTDKNTLMKFKEIGIKDSKELSDKAIRQYAREIRNTVGNKFEIICITPPSYNKLYERIGNVNRILGWAHAKVLENLLERCSANEAISDKFGDENLILNSLQTKGKKILLHQYTKAERFTAVAAASILARDKFVYWFEEKIKVLKIKLPKGASAEVERVASKIIAEYGEKYLYDLVKVHFKTTKKLVRSN